MWVSTEVFMIKGYRLTGQWQVISISISILSLLIASIIPIHVDADAPKPTQRTKTVRIAPQAPVIDDASRVAELTSRRAKVVKEIGNTGALILFSAEPRVYTNDVDYEYRQENNLFYLTNLKQKGSILVVIPGGVGPREILFLPKRNPALETWNGYMYSPETAQRISGINEIWDVREFESFVQALHRGQPYRPKRDSIFISNIKPDDPLATTITGTEPLFTAISKREASLYLLLPRGDDNREYQREQRFAADWSKTSSGFAVRDAWPIFTELRLRKSEMELKLLQHAIDITTEALGRAMATAGRAKWEYEVEAEVEYTFKRRNADYWGYPSIVGCGPNATTLHYNESQGPIKPGELILMDVGAEYEHYTADVTRTFPINGKFSPAQTEIYNLVLAAQEASMRVIRPGKTIEDVHRASVETIKDGLYKLGLITDRDSMQYRIWFMHGTSHWLGMNVHDVGERSTKFEPGMVFTVEPGIYIREDALDYLPKNAENEKFIAAVRPAFEKYKGIGVRIEDDVVVTNDSYRSMTSALPRTIPDIENFISKASTEIN
jgi:Xaa-Pro aminopeptidase